MKVRLTVDLDLPDQYAAWTAAEMRQMLFDSYVNYVHIGHLEDALDHYDSGGLYTVDEKQSGRQMYEHHREAAKFTKPVTWNYEKL